MSGKDSLTVNIHSGHYKEPDIHLPELPEFADTSDGDAYIAGNRMNTLYFHAPGRIDWAVVDNWIGMNESYVGDIGKVAGEWISVKDRLPERGVDVIALTDTGGVVKVSYTTTDGDYWVGVGGFLVVPDITHWMPLPAPLTPCNDDNGG